jgi:hypothetical protein
MGGIPGITAGIFFMWIVAAMPPSPGAVIHDYRYRESIGDEHRYYQWQMETGPPVIVVSEDDHRRFTNWCDPDGATVRWEVRSDTGDRVVAERRDNAIYLTGRFRGKAIDRRMEIDALPWFQPLSFSLRTLTTGSANHREFWTIRSDTLDVLAMRAERKSTEILTIGAQSVEAIRIVVSPKGWRGALWNSRYWFRADDSVFLRYHGVHGPPGTPPTIVELLP